MKKTTLALVGAEYNNKQIRKLEEKYGVSILHHDGFSVRSKDFKQLANKADCMVVVTRYCGHSAVEHAKKAASQIIPLIFSKQMNIDLIVQAGLQALPKGVAAC